MGFGGWDRCKTAGDILFHNHKNTERDTGYYSQLFHLLHAHRNAAGLLGDKPAQWQGNVNAQQNKIRLLNRKIG